MSILVAVLLFVPGLVVARILWRRVSRANPRHMGVAAAVSVSGFFALQFLTMFVLASFGLSKGCPDIMSDDCYVAVMADAFRWWYLVLFAICGALAYVGMRYCDHLASAK